MSDLVIKNQTQLNFCKSETFLAIEKNTNQNLVSKNKIQINPIFFKDICKEFSDNTNLDAYSNKEQLSFLE